MSLVPLLALCAAAYDSAGRALTETTKRNLSAEATFALNRFDAFVAETRVNLDVWSEQDVMQQALLDDGEGNIAAELKRLHEHYKNFAALLVTNGEGKVVATTIPEIAGRSVEDSPLFKAVSGGQSYESNVGATSLIGRSSIIIASPIHADYDSATIIGALVAIVDWTSLQPVFSSITITGATQDDAHRLVIVDTETSNVVYGPSIETPTIESSYPLARLTSSDVASFGLEGQRFVAATAVSSNNAHPLRVHAIVSSDTALANVYDLRTQLIALALVAIAFVGALGYIVIERTLTRPLSAMTTSIGDLARGNRDAEIPAIQRKDEIGNIARSLRIIRDMGVHAARIQTALDNTTSVILIADTDGRVFYGNLAARQYFDSTMEGTRPLLASMGAARLEELQVERFFPDPAGAKGRIESLAETWRDKVRVGGHTVDLAINPVVNEKGLRLGSVVEWTDLTDQVAMQNELQELVDAAAAGDFSRRVDLSRIAGFKRRIAEGINRWAETTAAAFAEVVRMMSAIAGGNLNVRISGDFSGDLLQLKQDANSTAATLAEIVGQTIGGLDSIRNATSRLADGASDLSSRTDKQANDLTEMAGSMRELATTVQQTAANARQASQLAEEARRAAESGGEVTTAAIEAVTRIESSSSRITEIVGAIHDIASQTNLLALNAAVEAARAGDAGRGFAVVAGEVRELAVRTAQASKEIKVLVGDSSAQVRVGVELVTKAGTALAGIVASTQHAADIVAQIAAASQQQAADVQNADESVGRIEATTQENAALVENAMTALAAVDQQISKLFDLISFFDATGKERASPAVTASSPTAAIAIAAVRS